MDSVSPSANPAAICVDFRDHSETTLSSDSSSDSPRDAKSMALSARAVAAPVLTSLFLDDEHGPSEGMDTAETAGAAETAVTGGLVPSEGSPTFGELISPPAETIDNVASAGSTGDNNEDIPVGRRDHGNASGSASTGAPGRGESAQNAPVPSRMPVRRSSLSFLSNWASSIRGTSQQQQQHQQQSQQHTPQVARSSAAVLAHGDTFMSNSPTIANLSSMAGPGTTSNTLDNHMEEPETPSATSSEPVAQLAEAPTEHQETVAGSSSSNVANNSGADGLFSVRLTPIIDHSTSNSGLYFAPVIRRIQPDETIAIGRYTEKNKSAAHAPQGSSQPIVFKSKVVSRTHALLQCRSDGLWFLKDCKSSSGTFLNNVRLSPATLELSYWPVSDGDVIQLGLDYRGGAEDIYRCVKMRCEFNHSWQRKVNQYNLEIHERMKNLHLDSKSEDGKRQVTECAICLLTLDPCQALFISPCSHSWHYKCIRPVIIKSYPQFYCPNCRSMCDLETDIEDEM